jgi:sugar phosphate isomerase/epimerase
MKYGFNLLLWTGHVTQEHMPLIKALKKTGYDEVELPVFEGTPDHYARLGEAIARLGLGVSTVSVLGAGNNSLSDNKAERQAAVARAKWVIDCNVALGSKILAGPMHSEIGRFTGNGPTKEERKRGIAFHRAANFGKLLAAETMLFLPYLFSFSNANQHFVCLSTTDILVCQKCFPRSPKFGWTAAARCANKFIHCSAQ